MPGFGKAVMWRERLRRYERAGFTVAEFCRREGVSVPSFYQWRRRLAETWAGPRPPQSTHPQPRQTVPAFQQVLLSGGEVVVVEWASGVRMELPAGNLALVRAVVCELLQAEASHSRRGA